jgi:hypothetical protein
MGMDEFENIEAEGAPATAEALRSIVARHQRARTRTLGIALAVALVAGPVAGWAVAQNGQSGGQRVASGGPDAARRNAPTAALGGGVGIGGGFGSSLPDEPPARHLFTRTTADGITIRAYRTDPPAPARETSPSTPPPSGKAPAAGVACGGGVIERWSGKPVPPEAGVSSSSDASSGASASASASSGANSGSPSGAPPPCPPIPPDCKPTPFVMAELSNDAAVGQGPVPFAAEPPSTPLSQIFTGMFGATEGSPATWATVQTGPGVATVRLRLPSGATDQMAPVEGVAVVAHGTPKQPAHGTVVEALDASGHVIDSQDVDQQGPRIMKACAVATARASGSGTAPVPVTAPPTTR